MRKTRSFTVFGFGKDTKREDEDTFNKRIRSVIEENTCATSGIKVFEHVDDSALDEYEMKVLENLRNAHEKWQSENSTPSKSEDDAFKSVKVRVG